ncbi:hypothetical protein BN129_803 [Cronobacter sakazakii 701]|nr:hypothetical protein BN129_803 [Cronobacter sakazakii 701]
MTARAVAHKCHVAAIYAQCFRVPPDELRGAFGIIMCGGISMLWR